jgi:hypothetical protein
MAVVGGGRRGFGVFRSTYRFQGHWDEAVSRYEYTDGKFLPPLHGLRDSPKNRRDFTRSSANSQTSRDEVVED